MSAENVPELDPLIHTQARLRIMSILAALPAEDRVAFPRLQELLDTTAGNLSTHLRKLEDADYVTIRKQHFRRTPVTQVALTTLGRAAFDDYRKTLRALLNADNHAPGGN